MSSSTRSMTGLLASLTFAASVSFCPAQVPTTRPAETNLMRAYPRYSYYTTEKDAQVVCEIERPDQDLAASVLVAADASGKTLSDRKDVRSRTFLPVPIATLPIGRHSVSVTLRNKRGEVSGRGEVTLLKLAPKPGCEWKIDRAEGVILNNGTPFFPFGIMADTRPEYMEERAKDIVEMGFNTVVRWGFGSFDKIEDLLELGRKYGFYVVEPPSYWRYTPAEGEEQEPQPPKETGWTYDFYTRVQFDWEMNHIWLPGAKRVMNHPNLMAWYLFDEPSYRPPLTACIGRYYEKMREVDGYHPAEVLDVPPFPEGKQYSDYCDIMGIDPYWVPGSGDRETGNPNYVAKSTWVARRRTDRDLKLNWVTPCAELCSATRLRIFTESEQRVQTYLALIQGARGLLYFVYPFRHQSTYNTFKRLGGEMKLLGPACASAEPPQVIAYTPTAFDPSSSAFPDVQVGLKKNPAGGYILLAANWKPYPVDVTYRISWSNESDKSDSVRLLFGKSTALKTAPGAFSDALASMDTRAYAVAGPAALTASAEIAVDLKAHPERTDSFYTKLAIPDGGLPGCKNFLRNSGFESCGIPGMPDYYWDFRTATTDDGPGFRLGDPRGDCGWGVATNQPYEGRQCLRLSGGGGVLFGVAPNVDPPAVVTFSAWVRGANDTNATFCFYGPGIDMKRYALAMTWRRFAQTVTLPSGVPYAGHLFGVCNTSPDRHTVIWVDAMQMEKGAAATEYQP